MCVLTGRFDSILGFICSCSKFYYCLHYSQDKFPQRSINVFTSVSMKGTAVVDYIIYPVSDLRMFDSLKDTPCTSIVQQLILGCSKGCISDDSDTETMRD